jgi:hypothetical protein
VPSVRFSRDKRGYEYVYLVHTTTRRGKPGRTLVIYWYRTPPGVRIGRKPFDEDVQRALEQQYPGVTFDWETIINTPMPPPDMTEFWRERRRAEKVAKQERRAEEAEQVAVAGALPAAAAEADMPPAPVDIPDPETVESMDTEAVALSDGPVESERDSQGSGKPRRRRGGRRRRGHVPEGTEQTAAVPDASDSQDDAEDDEMDDQPGTSDSTSEEE